MADYKHRIEVKETAEIKSESTGSVSGLQAVIGTAPVNMIKDPSSAVNVPIRVKSMEEARELLGYSDDWDRYTLCANMYASFEKYGLDNVVYINVLDPGKHKKENAEKDVTVKDKQAVYDVSDLIQSTVVVKNVDVVIKEGKDYLLSVNDEGKTVITLLSTGSAAEATTLKVTSSSLDPSLVTEDDIIGGYDAETGKRTGLELMGEIYPRLGLVPAVIAAPGWSHDPTVAAVMQTKTHEINDVFDCMAVIDIESTEAKVFSKAPEAKETAGISDKNAIAVWPMVIMNGKKTYYSGVYSAMLAYTAAENGDIPYKSPSNEALPVEAVITDDGTEVLLTFNEAEVINSAGIVTAINYGGWTSWGNNTACSDSDADIKDRYICNRLMSNWYRKHFIEEDKKNIDDPNDIRKVENLVDNENINLNTLVTGGYIAGGKAEYKAGADREELLAGHNRFLITLAFWTPLEYILGEMVISEEMLLNVLTGGEE